MTLENLDTVIGFVLILLLLSLLITSLVQLVGWMMRLREKNLLWGIQRVLEQLAPDTKVAALAAVVVKHKAVTTAKDGSATAIHFEEFVEVVKTVAGKDEQYRSLVTAIESAPVTQLTTLASSLETELEKVLPAEAARVKEAVERGKKAALKAGAQVRLWFDTVMGRTTERFVATTRRITVICAIGVAFGAQIDSIDLIKQLSQKPDVRARLVQMTDPVLKQVEALPPEAAPTGDPAQAKEEVARLTAQVKALQGDLARSSLQIIPSPFTYSGYQDRLLGMLMTAFFLSLGAPFWFNTLRQLSNLRPILAGKVEAKDKAAALT